MTQAKNPVLALSCLLGALLITFLAGCDSTPDKRAEPEEWVAIGDRVQVTDALHSEAIQADVYVDIDGTVNLPEIGVVQVAGRTATEIRELLMEKYGPYHDHLDLQVQITTGGEKYFIFGEVSEEGTKPLTMDLTVFEAVRTASPKANSANLGRVRLIRADAREPRVLVIDRSEIIDLKDRDIIHVPALEEPEPEPTQVPETTPDESWRPIWWACGGRSR